jgi:hypothetical protein
MIDKILEHRCLKWVRMTHLDISNKRYGQSQGWESNWQFDSRPLKVQNCLDFLTFRWHLTYHWKTLNEGYNFALDLISIGGLHVKLWTRKVAGVLVVRISRLPLRSLETKCHLDVGLMERHKVYYKGENGGFPQVWAMVSLVSLSLPMVSFVSLSDALPSPGVNPLEGSPKCSCGKLGLGRRSRLPTLERGRGSSWEPRDYTRKKV